MSIFKSVDNLNELRNIVDEEHIVLCDEMQNDFLIINLDHNKKIGIGYYSYGISPDLKYSNDKDVLYIGVSRNIVCINVNNCQIMLNIQLDSVFYQLLFSEKENYIYAICELDIYCYLKQKQIWKVSFDDVINTFKLIGDDTLLVSCDDDKVYKILLSDGSKVDIYSSFKL